MQLILLALLISMEQNKIYIIKQQFIWLKLHIIQLIDYTEYKHSIIYIYVTNEEICFPCMRCTNTLQLRCSIPSQFCWLLGDCRFSTHTSRCALLSSSTCMLLWSLFRLFVNVECLNYVNNAQFLNLAPLIFVSAVCECWMVRIFQLVKKARQKSSFKRF